MPKIENLLSNLALKNEKKLIVAINSWFDSTQKQIRKDLTEKFQKSFAIELTDWDFIEKDGISKIKPVSLEIFQSGGNATYEYLALEGTFDVVNVKAVKAVNKFCSELITEVSKNTKKGINAYVQAGVKEGKSMSKIASELKPLVGLTQKQTQAVINYSAKLQAKRPDITAAQLEKAKLKYANKLHRQRVQTIARTETARAQNIGYCQGLEEAGVEMAEFQISPTNCCDECESMNGNKYPVSDFESIIPVHPNCRCCPLPVIDDRTVRTKKRFEKVFV